MFLGLAGLFLGTGYLTAVYLNPTGGTVDVNRPLENTRETAATGRFEKPVELMHMETTTIQPAPMVERLRVSGELEPINRAILRAKDGGRILDVRAREGHTVEAGDMLVRFDTEELQTILIQREGDRDVAQAELLLAKQSLHRTEQLVQKNIAPREQLERTKSEVDAATARLKSLSAQVEIARTALRDADVLAPFDGVVSNRAVDPGSRVSANAELLTVVDISALEARVQVATRDVPRVSVEQMAELRIDGLGEEPVIGSVARISPVADEGTRFVPVYIRLSNRDGRLRGGMFASGSIRVRKSDEAIVLPTTALRKDRTGDYVLKLENGLLIRQSVIVGPKWAGNDSIEISKGLSEGDRVVTVPLPELRPNLAVTISKAD